MGVDFYSWVVVGVEAEKVIRMEPIYVTKYDEDTGEPHQVEHSAKKYFIGNTLIPGDDGTDTYLNEKSRPPPGGGYWYDHVVEFLESLGLKVIQYGYSSEDAPKGFLIGHGFETGSHRDGDTIGGGLAKDQVDDLFMKVDGKLTELGIASPEVRLWVVSGIG